MPTGIIDGFTGMSATIGSDHHYIHMGKGYALIGDTASLASGASESIYFKTPANGPIVHFRPARISSSANSMSCTMTEGAVMSGGTAAKPRNLNRMAADASLVVATTAATLTTAGATIFKDAVGSGGASNRSGGDAASGEERVLKPDTVYSITFTNTGATTATIGTYTLFWYEE